MTFSDFQCINIVSGNTLSSRFEVAVVTAAVINFVVVAVVNFVVVIDVACAVVGDVVVADLVYFVVAVVIDAVDVVAAVL